MIKVLFLIRSLDAGGAERQLVELVKNLDKNRFEAVVVTFYAGGGLSSDLASQQGVKLFSLEKSGRWNNLVFIKKLIDLIHSEMPDMIHGYLDVANLFALLAGKLTHTPVIWGVRAAYMDMKQYDWTASSVYRLTTLLSGMPDYVIVNSFAGKDYHMMNGYSSVNIVVIPNGINTVFFQKTPLAGEAFRHKWQSSEADVLIGVVGRLDPMKDHFNFIRAVSILSKDHKNSRFVCIGDGKPEYRLKLESESTRLGLQNDLIWTGSQTDMLAVYNALDILVLSSRGESFPNVVGEAMACGLPIVATDVGDVRRLVGEAGIVVEVSNSAALARGIQSLLDMPSEQRTNLGQRGRERIESLFSVNRMVERTQEVFEKLCKRKK